MCLVWIIEAKESRGAVQYVIEADSLGCSVTCTAAAARRFQTKEDAEQYIAVHDLAGFKAVERDLCERLLD